MLHAMPVPAVAPLLETTTSPPVKPNDVVVTEVGLAESFPLIQENALVVPPAVEKYTYCPLGPFQNPGVLKIDPTDPDGSSCCILSPPVRVSSPPTHAS